MSRTISDVEQALGAEAVAARVREADLDAVALERVLERVRQGQSRSEAIRAELPERPVSSVLRRLRVYEAGGRDALVSRRIAPPPPRKMTPELEAGLRALAVVDPTAGAEILAERLSSAFGVTVKTTSVQIALQKLGLARARGRPWWRQTQPTEQTEALALAGAELLKAVDLDTGAVEGLTRASGERLASLPVPEGRVEDDSADRNERGQFLASYNAPRIRLEADLGAKFNSVSVERPYRDLPNMRVVSESAETRYRKNLALVFLPVVVRGTRWSALSHWRGEQLGEICGIAYQANTLDKYLRELKLGGVADAMREEVAAFWLGREGTAVDATTGAAVVYADTATKPLWTHHWTRATRVSKTGRVMPATSLLTLHSGAGTPLVFRTFSGHVSLAAEIAATLDIYERHAGEQTAQRVVVMDREAHAIWVFDLLDSRRWGFVIPLRSHVVGPNAQFEDQSGWERFGEDGDEVCDAFLWLNDSRRGQKAKRYRVLGRKRHRTGKVAWFATNRPRDELAPADGIRLYFQRWPAQEHVYRDGTGAVGLDAHHGYGRRKVENVAVIDRHDRLIGQVHKLRGQIAAHEDLAREQIAEAKALREVLEHAAPQIAQDRTDLDAAIEREEPPERLRQRLHALNAWQTWIETSRQKIDALDQATRAEEQAVANARALEGRKEAEIESLADKVEIFTVDVELDEVMTAFKLTFMNLCRTLMRDHLGVRLELETLIDAVLTLPGERAVTKTTETVRIYRQPRDPKLMEAVERACASLTSRGLRRENRELRYELIAHPGRGATADPTDP